MSDSYQREELLKLLEAYCAGSLSDEQSRRIASVLRENPRARRDYLEYMDLHAALQWEIGSRAGIAEFSRRCREELRSESPGPVVKSPVLGFLSKISGGMRSASRSVRVMIPASVTVCVAVVTAVVLLLRGGDVHSDVRQPESTTNAAAEPGEVFGSGPLHASASPVAKASANGAGDARRNPPPPTIAANLARTTDCHWAQGTKAPSQGDPLYEHCRLELHSGVAEVLFAGGARGVLKGPASLEIYSADSAFLKQGELTLDNPAAKNFNLLSPDRQYMLSSAKFGLYVASADLQEFHVFRGRVALRDTSESPSDRQPFPGQPASPAPNPAATKDAGAVVLTVDESYRSGAGDKLVERLGPEGNRFVHRPQAPEGEPLLSPEFLRWEAASRKLRKDPSLIAYYDFQINPRTPTVLYNRAATGDKLNGQIEGAGLLQGRWPLKVGLQCHGLDHCVRLNIPGKYEVITAAAWVNIHNLTLLTSLLDAEWWHAAEGQCYWRLFGDGRMVIGRRATSARTAVVSDDVLASIKPVVDAKDSGGWCLLVAIYDSRSNTVTYFKNGLAYGSVQPTTPLRPVIFGPVELCNGGDFMPTSKTNIQYFHGFIDEFMLFSRALSLEEIQEIATIGKCDEKRW